MNETLRPIRVLVADDHGLIREAIRLALGPEPDIEVVGEAERGDEVLERVRDSRPNLLLLDIKMPGLDGLEVLELVRTGYPQLKTAMLSAIDEPDVAEQALRRGAVAYLGKRVDPCALAPTIRQIMDGQLSMETFGLARKGAAGSGADHGLSARETEILKGVAAGLSNRQIAQQLWLSEHTVKYHLTNVYRKLGVSGRTDAAGYAFEHGIADRFSA
jgi:DNA-binding NarL/FixJ family response regulator